MISLFDGYGIVSRSGWVVELSRVTWGTYISRRAFRIELRFGLVIAYWFIGGDSTPMTYARDASQYR